MKIIFLGTVFCCLMIQSFSQANGLSRETWCEQLQDIKNTQGLLLVAQFMNCFALFGQLKLKSNELLMQEESEKLQQEIYQQITILNQALEYYPDAKKMINDFDDIDEMVDSGKDALALIGNARACFRCASDAYVKKMRQSRDSFYQRGRLRKELQFP